MTKKILSYAIIFGVVFGIIFLIKFVPVYTATMELEKAFSYCISNWQGERDAGCRRYFNSIIEKNGMSLTAEQISIDAAINNKSTVEVEYVEKLDFFGIWTYEKTFHIKRTGVVPSRT